MDARPGQVAVVALGSNLGDRERTLRHAIHEIDQLAGVRVLAASDIFETPALKPEGIDAQAPSYLNAVVTLLSRPDPQALLLSLHEIEARFGRERIEHWGDRTLDLDLIDFSGLRLSSETIELPHPRAWQRAFVLAPWVQLQPDATLAGRGKIQELLANCSDPVTIYPAPPLLEASPFSRALPQQTGDNSGAP